MATLRNRRKLTAVSRETLENTRKSQPQNTLDSVVAQEYISQVSNEIEDRVTKNFFREFSRTESCILGALCKPDQFLLHRQVRICSVAALGTFRNNDTENRDSTGDRFLGDPCPEAVFSSCYPSNPTDSEQEETHHNNCCNTQLLGCTASCALESLLAG